MDSSDEDTIASAHAQLLALVGKPKAVKKRSKVTRKEPVYSSEDEETRIELKKELMQAIGGSKKRKRQHSHNTHDNSGEETKKVKKEEGDGEEAEYADVGENDRDAGVDNKSLYLKHALTAEDLLHLRDGKSTLTGSFPSLGSSARGSFYKRVVKVNATEKMIKDNQQESVKLSKVKSKSIEEFLVSACDVIPFLAKNLAKLVDEYLAECKAPKSLATNFMDLVFNNYSVMNMASTRTQHPKLYKLVYVGHVINVVLKSKMRIGEHQNLLKKMTEIEREQADMRDRGVVRPHVLVMLPMRKDAHELMFIMLKVLEGDDRTLMVDNKKKFCDEYEQLELDEQIDIDTYQKKPDDYKKLFTGLKTDDFRFGMTLTKNNVRFFSAFNSSDVIIGSPAGLRMVIGTEGESHHQFDFLASMQLVVADGVDVFQQQSWENLLHVYKHLHMQPKEMKCDIFRVYEWALEGHAKHYCQHIGLSEVCNIQAVSLLRGYCKNYKGLVQVRPIASRGTISLIPKAIAQEYHQVRSKSLAELSDSRFKFYVDNIFKKIIKEKMMQVLVYIPDYFDFVRVRNYMRKKHKDAEGLKFRYISEYAEPKEAGKARRKFVAGEVSVLLYTERYHFYNRPYVKGIQHLIFYDLPTYPHYYNELVNMMKMTCADGVSDPSVLVMYSPRNRYKLEGVLGEPTTKKMVNSDQDLLLFLMDAPKKR